MSELLCKKCNHQMQLRDGDEPTPYCDSCAQGMIPDLIKQRDAWKKLAEELKACQPSVLRLVRRIKKEEEKVDKLREVLQRFSRKGNDAENVLDETK